ncbi:MAG: glycogen/starch/alpha-glucan phosphorylase [Candidatus Omnitrophota bacterium]
MTEQKKRTRDQIATIYKGMTAEAMKLSFLAHQEYTLAKDQYSATKNDDFWALAFAVRDRVVERWIHTQQTYHKQNVKRVYYLSMEFLIGRLLGNYTVNLGLKKEVEEAMVDLGFDLEELREQEMDAGLGNGGLGRLAACYLDSMATLGIPAHGYGILFDYGIFKQKIKDGYQVELPDAWISLGSPWAVTRPEYAVKVRFYGRSDLQHDATGRLRAHWVDTQDVLALPYDFPIPGYKNDVVNTLRLWAARSTEEFDFDYFKDGDYERAVHQKILSENISKVLYPSDDVSRGRELRLKQEYFFTAASIGDIIRRFKSGNDDLRKLPDKVTIQLNDTHPSLAIAELMRVLLDDYDFAWDDAWSVVTGVFAYTNHTLMPEALERWSVDMLSSLLPRHLQIIYEINARFLNDVADRFPGDHNLLNRVSIIEEGVPKKVRMSHLCVVGSYAVNGVSKLHSELLKTRVFRDFYMLYPGKFLNITNGITQRRWLLKANPLLSGLITESIGDGWIRNLEELHKLNDYRDKKAFKNAWRLVKDQNKRSLANYIQKSSNISIDPQSLFDVHIKRIHEYKRQVLFCLYIISQYLQIKNEPSRFVQPRTFIVGGKAAPGYYLAKLSIKFINNIADVINRDRSVRDKMRVVFLENYRVSLAERVFPASDLSEQISTAGTEASGTGNMKFMLNGALTIGTLDGATIEISEKLAKDDIFIFGLKAHEVEELRRQGYNPGDFINHSPSLGEIITLIAGDFFSAYHPGLFNPLLDMLMHHDPYMVCADFDAYCRTQDKVSQAYLDQDEWTSKSIANVAQSGTFSSDRAIREYAKNIWNVQSHG